MCGHHIYMQEWLDSFIGEKLEFQREEANEQDPYAVVVIKIAAGCTENQGSLPQADRQYGSSLFLQ